MNRYGAHASPCRIPATMSKKSVSPSGEQNYTFVFFYRASLWGDNRLEVFASSSLFVWIQMPWRNLQIRMSPRGSLHEPLQRFDVMLWIGFSENHFDFSKGFSQFLARCG